MNLAKEGLTLPGFYWICKACGASPKKEVVELIKAFNTME